MQGYGFTEAAPSVLMQSPGDGVEHAGAAGAPAFFTDVRLRTPDGRPAAVDEPGELEVFGPNVVSEYWRRPDVSPLNEDGWLCTGDVAVVDEIGDYRIIDRLKDMFISGGENVYPAEVEAALRDHPGVVDVAVIGMPDPVWGEVGKALVVAEPGLTADELRNFARAHLGKYKIPKVVVFVDGLPRNPTGKVDKQALRRREGAPDRTPEVPAART